MPSYDAKHWLDRPTAPPFSLDVTAHRGSPEMSRSVDPPLRQVPLTIALISLQDDQVPPIGSFLRRQQDFPNGFDDRGLKGSDEKMRHDLTNAIPDWPLLARSEHSPKRLTSERPTHDERSGFASACELRPYPRARSSSRSRMLRSRAPWRLFPSQGKCDFVVDWAVDQTWGPDSAGLNQTLYLDGTHPSQPGQNNANAPASA